MFCHRTGSHKPDGELIDRFQKLCGKSFFNSSAANDKQALSNSFPEDNAITPSEGARKRSKTDISFTFDGCEPPDNFASSISEDWQPHQSRTFGLPGSQSKATTIFDDLVEGRRSPKTIIPNQNDLRLDLSWQPDNLLGDQPISTSSGSGGVYPTQLWPSIDRPVPGELPLNQYAQPSSDYGSLEFSADSLNLNQPGVSSDEIKWNSFPETSGDINTINPQNAINHEGNQFRYNTTLRAPTAMVNDSSESPVSYLNKGQVYYLTVTDSMPSIVNTGSGQYQTFVRISFADEQQRSDPTAYWQLWKSARGYHQLKQGDEKLRAVEYMGQKSAQMNVEKISHDGFCINWTGNPADGLPRCSIPVRFNFLSTDFTLSKGVKGIQVRFCAKTKQLGEVSVQNPEICFCNVKLFRDHGAERKLSNDVASIHKKIERLKLQMKEPAPIDPSNKRKRNSLAAKPNPDLSYSKSNLERQDAQAVELRDGQHQTGFHRQLQQRLDALEKTLYSTRPESFLSLRAGDREDPELYPSPPLEEYDSQHNGFIPARRPSKDEPSSIAKPETNRLSETDSPKTASSLGNGIRNDEISPNSSTSDKAACFYIRIMKDNDSPNEHYRAIYPRVRTVQELVSKIFDKSSMEPKDVRGIFHINQAGLKIVVDDEFVWEMAEGQNMIVRIVDVPSLDAPNNTQCEILLEY